MPKNKTVYENCDVLVVGGGMAGTGAAFEARHWNILNITAKHPVLLELCSYEDLNKAIIKAGGDPTTSEVQVNTISELP